MLDVEPAVNLILAYVSRLACVSRVRAVLAAITGIDASGKGYVTERIAERLREHGKRVAVINADGWLELPARRFSADNPAEHFYAHAIRFDEMFAQLVLPLRDRRSLHLEADLADPTGANVYRRHTYDFAQIDVVLLEGIFLLIPAYRKHYDLSFWVECSFETALERGVQRAQEGLPPAETIREFETIYFPAQRIHLERDQPRLAATAIIVNDPLMSV